MVDLTARKQPLAPVRGLVLTRNAEGSQLAGADIGRWIRLNRVVHKTAKIDVLANAPLSPTLPELIAHSREYDVALSLRTDAASPPGDDLDALASEGLYDVFLCPDAVANPHLDAWLEACRRNGLPVRVQLQAPFDGADAPALARRLAAAGVPTVNVAASDAFGTPRVCGDPEHNVETMNALAAACASARMETNLLRVPLCLAFPENRRHCVNSARFFGDHQHYRRAPYELAVMLHAKRPATAGIILRILLGRHTHFDNPVDRAVLPWLVRSPWLHGRAWIWHKLTSRLRLPFGAPRAIEDSAEAHEAALAKIREHNAHTLGALCAQCSLHRICDGATEPFRRAFPGVTLKPQTGEEAVSPFHFAAGQPSYYDSIDTQRLEADATCHELAQKANAIVNSGPPTREIPSHAYRIEGQWTQHLAGGVRWFSFTNSEKTSTVLERAEAPVTLSVTVGGGIAAYVGFSFGRHCRLVCPMVTFAHKLVLHVAEDGRYVLLRDGFPVRPAEFDGACYAPLRLGRVLEPRISIWNIDGAIVTQSVLVWEGDGAVRAGASGIAYSVVLVCTRYARRLQAVLRAIAHQQGVNLDTIEVIAAYVPGLDATGDVIESAMHSYPGLRIVPSPFPEPDANAKGFMLNESVRLASGKWIVLLDADTLLPPDWFAAMAKLPDDTAFAAPDGRKMLGPEATARILMGEAEPWREWDELLSGPGEFRLREGEGVPIGYCQCVKARCLDKVRYDELDHFEGADWRFGDAMLREFGPAARVEGVPVMHLDHGGSQWYGTKRHL